MEATKIHTEFVHTLPISNPHYSRSPVVTIILEGAAGLVSPFEAVPLDDEAVLAIGFFGLHSWHVCCTVTHLDVWMHIPTYKLD